jgi:hypothetical protein
MDIGMIIDSVIPDVLSPISNDLSLTHKDLSLNILDIVLPNEASGKPVNTLSKEAMFISKLLSTVSSNGDYNNYKTLRNGYDEYLLNGIPEAIKNFAETGKSISSPIFQLVFNLEDMLDNVYKKAKEDARIEILTELEAVYSLKKRGEASSSSCDDGDESSSEELHNKDFSENIEIDYSCLNYDEDKNNHHISMEDII